MKCASCNAEINPEDQFCGNCGEKNLPPIAACPGCGTEVQEGDQFCGECGQILTGETPTTAGDDTTEGFQSGDSLPLPDKKKPERSKSILWIALVIIGLLVAFYFFYWQPNAANKKDKTWFPQPPQYQPEIQKKSGFKDLAEPSDADRARD
jgi:predicted nucleic acid-binding Zn ribbon protein